MAAVFAIHPLRVESVAWVAERKDVLSGLFFMLTLWAYVRYVQVASGKCRRNRPSFPLVTAHFYCLVVLFVRVGVDVQADAGDAAVRVAAAGLLAAQSLHSADTGPGGHWEW